MLELFGRQVGAADCVGLYVDKDADEGDEGGSVLEL